MDDEEHEHPHGTWYGYHKRHCRCPLCVDWASERRYMERVAETVRVLAERLGLEDWEAELELAARRSNYIARRAGIR